MRIKSLLAEDAVGDKRLALHVQQIISGIDDVDASIAIEPHTFAVDKCLLRIKFEHCATSLELHVIDDTRPRVKPRFTFIAAYKKDADSITKTFGAESLDNEEEIIDAANSAFNSIIGELEQQRLNEVAAAFSKEHQISYWDYDICKKKNVGPVLPYSSFDTSPVRVGQAVRDGKKVESVIILKPSNLRDDPAALALFHNAINDFNDQVLRKHKASLLLSEIDHQGKRFVYAI